MVGTGAIPGAAAASISAARKENLWDTRTIASFVGDHLFFEG
jgi:hypothetical protein